MRNTSSSFCCETWISAIRGGEEVGYQGRKRRKTTLSGTAWSLLGWAGVVVVGLSLALGSGLITVCTRR